MSVFFVRFDFDADLGGDVGFEEHGEPGRLLWCPDGVQKLPRDSLGGPGVALSGGECGVSMPSPRL